MTSMTGLDVFDTTIHKTNSWLKEIMEELGIDNRHQAYQALRGTLQALRDRLPVEEATHLGAQLPMLITGIYYEGWEPEDKPERIRHKEEFLARVGEAFGGQSNMDSERAARAVFNVLARRVSEGEIQDITGILPQDLRELWPAEIRC
jgi:uncharacterized protein (DUF2267 family)